MASTAASSKGASQKPILLASLWWKKMFGCLSSCLRAPQRDVNELIIADEIPLKNNFDAIQELNFIHQEPLEDYFNRNEDRLVNKLIDLREARSGIDMIALRHVASLISAERQIATWSSTDARTATLDLLLRSKRFSLTTVELEIIDEYISELESAGGTVEQIEKYRVRFPRLEVENILSEINSPDLGQIFMGEVKISVDDVGQADCFSLIDHDRDLNSSRDSSEYFLEVATGDDFANAMIEVFKVNIPGRNSRFDEIMTGVYTVWVPNVASNLQLDLIKEDRLANAQPPLLHSNATVGLSSLSALFALIDGAAAFRNMFNAWVNRGEANGLLATNHDDFEKCREAMAKIGELCVPEKLTGEEQKQLEECQAVLKKHGRAYLEYQRGEAMSKGLVAGVASVVRDGLLQNTAAALDVAVAAGEAVPFAGAVIGVIGSAMRAVFSANSAREGASRIALLREVVGNADAFSERVRKWAQTSSRQEFVGTLTRREADEESPWLKSESKLAKAMKAAPQERMDKLVSSYEVINNAFLSSQSKAIKKYKINSASSKKGLTYALAKILTGIGTILAAAVSVASLGTAVLILSLSASITFLVAIVVTRLREHVAKRMARHEALKEEDTLKTATRSLLDLEDRNVRERLGKNRFFALSLLVRHLIGVTDHYDDHCDPQNNASSPVADEGGGSRLSFRMAKWYLSSILRVTPTDLRMLVEKAKLEDPEPDVKFMTEMISRYLIEDRSAAPRKNEPREAARVPNAA